MRQDRLGLDLVKAHLIMRLHVGALDSRLLLKAEGEGHRAVH